MPPTPGTRSAICGAAAAIAGRLGIGREREHAVGRRETGAHHDVVHSRERRRRFRDRARLRCSPPIAAIERFEHDRTVIDRHEIVRTRAIESEHGLGTIARARPAPSCCGTRAARPCRSARCTVDVAEAADARERVDDDAVLPRQLRGIGEMLHLAAAAFAEHGTERLGAIGRGRLALEHFTDRVLRLDFGQADARAFARQRTVDEHDHAVESPDGLAVGQQIVKTRRPRRRPA